VHDLGTRGDLEANAACYLEIQPGNGFIWKPYKQKLARQSKGELHGWCVRSHRFDSEESCDVFPGVAKGTSYNQSSFKAGTGAFLYIGPGNKGKGFKAMFRLKRSMPQARKLTTTDPGRFEVGSTGWVATRFTA